MKKDPVLDALRSASKGLVFTSETDARLEPFVWQGGDDRVRDLTGDPNVEKTSLDDFFRVVPSEDRPRFQKLTQVLEQQLSEIKVYKVGDEAEKTVYIVGTTADGRWAGLKTTVVET